MYLDALNFTLCIDKKLHNRLSNLTFDSSVYSLSGPFEISHDLTYPKPLVSTIANWLTKPENEVDTNKLELMKRNLDIIEL